MARINEFGEIIREENEVQNMQKETNFEDLKRKVINYIENDDYNQATYSKNNIVNEIKDNYIDFLLNRVGIRNENILKYAVDNFKEVSLELQKMLEERKDKHIESKSEIITSDYIKNTEYIIHSDKTESMLGEQTQINYEDRVKQILTDKINDSINQIRRVLDNLEINENKIEEISYALYEKRNELLKYSLKIEEMLEGLDSKITKFVQRINEESLEKENNEEKSPASRFNDYKVDNSGNKFEKNAILACFNDEREPLKEQNQDDPFNPKGIFENAEKPVKHKEELGTGEDIFR